MKSNRKLIQFWLLINRLYAKGKPVNKNELIELSEIKLFDLSTEYEQMVSDAIKKKLLAGNPDLFILTEKGITYCQRVCNHYSLHGEFYNIYYKTVSGSKAHSRFCHSAYGKNLNQHGMADLEQIHLAINELEIDDNMDLLEFGCGDGQTAEYIAGIKKINITGIDIAYEAIRAATARTKHMSDRLAFLSFNPEKDPVQLSKKYDRVLAVDSFFFVHNQRNVLEWLKMQVVHKGLIGLFYISPPDVKKEETRLFEILDAMNLKFKVIDLTNNNKRHWKKKKQVLIEFEDEFVKEGNALLFKNRMIECEGSVCTFNRYFFVIEIS